MRGKILTAVLVAAVLKIGGWEVVVGQKADAAGLKAYFDCPESAVQKTIMRCALNAEGVLAASSFGYKVQAVVMNVHFQGEVENMSVDYGRGVDVDVLLKAFERNFSRRPVIHHWATPMSFYASHQWIDGTTETQLTKTLKGPAENAVAYVSSLVGDRPVHPDDAKP